MMTYDEMQRLLGQPVHIGPPPQINIQTVEAARRRIIELTATRFAEQVTEFPFDPLGLPPFFLQPGPPNRQPGPPKRFSAAFGALLRKRMESFHLLSCHDRRQLKERVHVEFAGASPCSGYEPGWIFQDPTKLFKDP